MHQLRRIAATALAALMTTAGAGVALTPTAQAGTTTSLRAPGVTQVAVSFRVRNVNRSDVACASDGRTYTIRGHLVAPSALLARKKVDLATLYLHGLSFGEFFYRPRAKPDYDYAQAQARNGHASVVVDRLGYGRSGVPDGRQVCVGSRADMAHQMVRKLRSGRYQVDGASKPTFGKVVLAGHSYGGQIAQVEAYSFGDVAGLVVLGYADRVQSDVLRSAGAYAAGVCATGGQSFKGHLGYAPFGPPSGAAAALFSSAGPRVKNAVLPKLSIDPCGDTASFAAATAVDLQRVGSIKVPVLVVAGADDALFPRPAAPDQAALFTSSRKVKQVTLARTGHAFTFESGRTRLVKVVDGWLGRF